MRSMVWVGLLGILGLVGACAGSAPQGEGAQDPGGVRGVGTEDVKCDPPTTDPTGKQVCGAHCILVGKECKYDRGIIIYEKTPPPPH